MSNGSINLRDPRLVITVAVLLTVVAAINVKTFMPKRGPGAVAEWEDEAFVLPADTAELARQAAAQVTAGGPAAPSAPVALAGGMAAGGLRDPFHHESRPAAPPPPPRARAASQPPVEKKPELTCAAVLLGGKAPVAFIGGSARHVGDEFDGHELVSIGPGGAWLRGPRGDVYLPVGDRAESSTRYPLVTDSPQSH